MRYIIPAIIILLSVSCNNIDPKQNDDKFFAINENSLDSVPAWLNEGSDAYGLMVYADGNKPLMGKPIPCKVLKISKNGVKCIATEKVALFDQFNCYKIGIEKDEIWYDLPGELFKTKEDAIKALKERDLLTTNIR